MGCVACHHGTARAEQWKRSGEAEASGGLAALTVDPTTLPLGRAAPDSLTLPIGERVLEAGLSHDALIADRLRFGRLLIGDRIEHIWVDAPAGCLLAPGGTHENVTS